ATSGASAPSVTTLPVPESSVHTTTVIVSGLVNPNGSATSYWFEYSASKMLASFSKSSVQNLPAGTSATMVSAPLAGLVPHTVYYYRITAQNGAATSRGGVMEFRSA